MRNILFFTLSVCAILLASCSKSDIDATMLSKDTVTAILPDNEQQTRTTINGLQVVWSAEDAISVFTTKDSGYANDKGTIKEGDEGKTSADFEIVRTGTDKVASLYPYYSSSSYNGTSISVVMPDSYNYVENGIGGSPMAALISDQSAPIAFKNAGALLAVTINNIPANYSKATLESTGNEVIAGESIITFTDGIPTIKPSDNNTTAKSVTINFASSSQATNKTFYFPLVVNNYSNLKLTISDGSNTKILFEAGLNAARNKRYYKTLTLDVVSGDTPTDAASSADATAALAGTNGSEGASSVNVTIGAGESATPTISLPKQDNPESSSTTLSFNSIPDNKVVTIQEAALANDEKPSENVYIYASSDAISNNSFDINLPQSTVTLNATTGTAVYETVTALTADNTLVVGNGVTVKKLVVKGGNVRVRGSIESISRHEDNENPVYLYVEEGAKIPANLGEGFVAVSGDKAEVATLVELNAAIANPNIKEIKLTENIKSGSVIWIKRSLTLDLNNKTLSATTNRLVRVSTDTDNNPIVVTIKNGTILNSIESGRSVETRSGNVTLNLDGVGLSTPSNGANQPLTIGGSGTNIVVNISNSNISTNTVAGYAITTFNPVDMTVDNSTVEGYCAFNIKVASSSVGSAGSTFDVKGSTLIGTNAVLDGESNSFTTIMIEDKNVTFSVDAKSTVKAVATNSNSQTLVTIGNETIDKGKITGTKVTFAPNATLTLTGDNAKPMGIAAGENLEGNTFKFPKAFAETLEKHNWIVSDPDVNSLVTVTGQIAEVGTDVEFVEALNNVNISEVVLTDDIALTNQINVQKAVKLDLNKHTITANDLGSFPLLFTNDVTIKNGTYESNCLYGMTFDREDASNRVVIENMTFNFSRNDGNGTALLIGGANATLGSGVIINAGGSYSALEACAYSETTGASTVNINGAKINVTKALQFGAVSVSMGATLNFNSGEVDATSGNYAVYALPTGCTINLKGGIIKGKLHEHSPADPKYNRPVEIIVTGGTYSVNPTDYLAKGYKATETNEGFVVTQDQ